MLKLIKNGKALSKEDMLSSNGGKNCGSMGCDCGDQGITFSAKQYMDYQAWYAHPL